jgi:hypothetical protein
MQDARTLKIIFALSLGGTFFAGYLSAVKIFSGICAFNEPCPYFLGYPSCWYGFAMFLAQTLASGFGLAGMRHPKNPLRLVAEIATLGTLFAGYFVSAEIFRWLSASVRYALVLPTASTASSFIC